MMKKRFLFLANPITGKNGISELSRACEKSLNDGNYHWDILSTEYAGHASELTTLHKDNYNTIVALGGDGTINEIAKSLINSQTSLGIIPNGSGNGLARHLGISLNINQAVQELILSKPINIDVAWANDIPFFNVAGIGFDALVAKKFQSTKKRGFMNYILISAKEFLKFSYPTLHLETNSSHFECKQVFSLTIANGSQLGNNAVVAKSASLTDGIFNLCLIRRYPVWYLPIAVFRLFSGTLEKSRFHSGIITKDVNVCVLDTDKTIVQIDGEPVITKNPVHFSITPASLSILVPSQNSYKAS